MTELEQVVYDWVVDQTGYHDSEESVIDDLLRGGCQSGMVNGLICYADTVAFYTKHSKEINSLLYDLLDGFGGSLVDLFGDKWDATDPLALDRFNQNLLAWFGFEETARKLFDK